MIPLFSEDYAFVEEILPLIVAQEYPDFEVVIVYVGRDTDFYDDLVRIKQSFPQITATKIELNPRFPISPKMALNVGIKSAHYEHLLFTTPDVYPTSDRWLSLMANGFRRGEIVLGYCGMERGKGFASYLIRTWRMMHSVDWISSAVCGRPYRGMRQNYGFTKRLYFGANGFSHLNMNIGEDDLFMSRIIAPGNVSVVLSPRATLREKSWGGLKWWIGTQRFFGEPFLLSLVGQELHPVGTGQPHSLLAGGDRRPGGDALGIQDRRRVLLLARFAIVLVGRGASAAAWVKRKSADVTSCTTC